MELYYRQEGITIYHGDCREGLSALVSEDIDLVLTDPPYNTGKQYGQHNDSMTREEYHNWCESWFRLSRQVCRRTIIFPGNGNLDIWWNIDRPSGVGCWYKPGNPASSILGWDEWEPWLYWGPRVGGSSVVRATITRQQGVGDHPCPKPLSLMGDLLKKFKTRMVLDPFVGSGTTLVAARLSGSCAIGIEIEERYCEISAQRLDRLRAGGES